MKVAELLIEWNKSNRNAIFIIEESEADKPAEEQNDLYHFEREGVSTVNRMDDIIPNSWKENYPQEYNDLINKEVVKVMGNTIVIK